MTVRDRLGTWAMLPAAVLIVSACSDSEPVDSGVPAATADTQGQSDTDQATGSAPPVATADRSVEVASDGTLMIEADQASFVMPSGNIQCVIRAESAVCQISEKDFEPAQPDLSPDVLGDCTTATADTLALLSGQRSAWTCNVETIRGQASLDHGGWWAADGVGSTEEIEGTPLAVLAYGERIQLGSVLCSSETTGVSCRLLDAPHGFSLSREDYLAG